jgi:hypothetical protein
MDVYDAIASAHGVLNEQIARNIFDALPEPGPIVVVMDREGHCWSSNPQEFARLRLNASLLADMRAKVDDGAEPAFTNSQDTSLAMTQLPTENTGCGYLLVALPRCGPELTQTQVDLIESLVNQIALVACLTEHNHILQERQAMYHGVHESHAAIVN